MTPDVMSDDVMTPDVMSDELLTIRQMSEAFDVTPRTLRFYESKELLFPLRRGTQRLFTRSDRVRLKLILRGKRFGFTLEDIRQTLAMYDRNGSNQAQLLRACDLAVQRLHQMETQRTELDVAIAELKAELAAGATTIAGYRRAAE